jgi:sRNA-binding carbon storage regulator CsrA
MIGDNITVDVVEKDKAPMNIGAYLPKPTTVTLLLQQYFYVEKRDR